jgi:arsenite methyltransferase
VVVDVGFGGGLSLSLLLEAVGEDGAVHGIEISPVALQKAKQQFRHDLSIGRLRLHQAPITSLPFTGESLSPEPPLGS